MLALVALYLFALFAVRNVVSEVKQMEILAEKQDGALWEQTYDSMPLQSVQAIVISFAVVQLLVLLAIMGHLFKFA